MQNIVIAHRRNLFFACVVAMLPAATVSAQDGNTKLKIMSATFGDRKNLETCDASWFYIKACHFDDVATPPTTVLKDDKSNPSYCFVKRTGSDAESRYDGTDLCGYRPSPLGSNELTIQYRCMRPAGAPANGSGQRPKDAIMTVHFPGYVEWTRLVCAE